MELAAPATRSFRATTAFAARPFLSCLALAGVITAVAFVLSCMLFMLGYVYRDAKRRGMHPALWTLLVLILSGGYFFIGLIIYLLSPRAAALHLPAMRRHRQCALQLLPQLQIQSPSGLPAVPARSFRRRQVLPLLRHRTAPRPQATGGHCLRTAAHFPSRVTGSPSCPSYRPGVHRVCTSDAKYRPQSKFSAVAMALTLSCPAWSYDFPADESAIRRLLPRYPAGRHGDDFLASTHIHSRASSRAEA